MKKSFKLKMLHGTVTIVVSKNLSKIAKEHDLQFKGSVKSYDAFVFQAEKNRLDYFICFEKKYISHSTIAHEITHLVNAIYIDHSIYHDCNNDEWNAYFTGWLTKKIYKILNTRKKAWKV